MTVGLTPQAALYISENKEGNLLFLALVVMHP